MILARRAWAVAAVAALMLTGCGRGGGESGGTGAEQAKEVSAGKAKGTITVWAMGTEGEKLGVLAKQFEAENPGTTVKVTAVPWDAAHDKISTAIAGRQTPDVSLVGTTWMGEFAQTGALDPTPSLIDRGAFFDGARQTTEVGGKSYGVPWYVETRLIYYRKDLAAKAGLSEPKNWADLKAFAKSMKEKAGAKWGISLQPGGTGSWQTFLPFAWQNGAKLTSGDQSAFTIDSPQMAKALDYYTSFFTEGLSPKDLPQGALESGFVKGEIGAFVSGPWHIGILADQGGPAFKDKIGVAHMPTEQRGTSFVGGGDLVVFKDSKNRDAAWKFVAFLSKPEVQATWYKTVADLPAVKAAWQTSALAADPMVKAFGSQLEDAQSPPAIATWEQVADVIDAEVEKAVKGVESPQAAVTAMQQKAQAIGFGR